MEGLYITDLGEDKITIDENVVAEIQQLRTERTLELCFTPLYHMDDSNFKVCYLNARSLHKHIDDVRNDFNLCSSDLAIFSETRFLPCDPDDIYNIDGYHALFRRTQQTLMITDDHLVVQPFTVKYHLYKVILA